MFCRCLEWQWVKRETVWNIGCWDHRSPLVHGVMSTSGTVSACFSVFVITCCCTGAIFLQCLLLLYFMWLLKGRRLVATTFLASFKSALSVCKCSTCCCILFIPRLSVMYWWHHRGNYWLTLMLPPKHGLGLWWQLAIMGKVTLELDWLIE